MHYKFPIYNCSILAYYLNFKRVNSLYITKFLHQISDTKMLKYDSKPEIIIQIQKYLSRCDQFMYQSVVNWLISCLQYTAFKIQKTLPTARKFG